MCTVMGTLAAMPRETFERSLARTHTRGPDAQRVLPLDGGGFLGFQRLAIMGPGESGMQRGAVWLSRAKARPAGKGLFLPLGVRL